ncbi:MAG: hypothetical protein JWO12_3383 [Frankiales bacterium]|nr:hypothetical protein [Frankiales bacterium]
MVSRVTAPLRASRRPLTDKPVLAVTEVRASTVPRKVLLVPNVAELPTCQKTEHALAPFTSTTWLADAVMRVLALWKTKTAFGSPMASRVRVPVRARSARCRRPASASCRRGQP